MFLFPFLFPRSLLLLLFYFCSENFLQLFFQDISAVNKFSICSLSESIFISPSFLKDIFTSEVYYHLYVEFQVENFFPSTLEKCNVTSFWSQWFLMRNPWSFQLFFPCISGVISPWLLSILSLVFKRLIMMCFDMDFYGSSCWGHSTLKICRFISFTKFEKFWDILSLSTFPALFFFSTSSTTPTTQMLDLLL